MSKLFSPITEMPGKSGKSSTASGMTRYAVNKSFAKGGTMSRFSWFRRKKGKVRTSPGVGGGGAVGAGATGAGATGAGATGAKKPKRTRSGGAGGVGGGGSYMSPLTGLVTKPIGPLARGLGTATQYVFAMPFRAAETATRGVRRLYEGSLARKDKQLQQLIDRTSAKRKQITDTKTSISDFKTQEGAINTIGRNKARQAGEWVQEHPLLTAALLGGAGKLAWDFATSKEEPKDEGPKGYKPNNTYRTSARGIGMMGKGMYKGMGGMCKCGSGMRKGMCKCGGMGKRMTKRAVYKNTNDARMRDEMRRSGSAQYRGNPQTTTTASPLEQLYAYVAPRVASAAREAERTGRNAYGGALNYGGQVADLIANERAKGIGPRSRTATISFPNFGYSQTVNVPTMNELYERAKTVGARPRTGRYDESNAVERALQFVRDWGESNAPTAKPKITGPAVYTTHNRGRMKVKDGEFVPYYQDVDMGTKTPKQQKATVREDVVYGGGSLGGRGVKPTMQVWDTATMSERGKKWTPQMQVKDNLIYDADAKRYKSTRQRDADAITAFEMAQRAPVRRVVSASEQTQIKPLLRGFLSNYEKSMKKSVSSMRSAGTRHLVGGYRGGKAMMKALHKADSMRNPAYVSLPKGSSGNFGNYKMPTSTPTPTPTSTPKSTTPPYISYNASGYKSPYSNFMNPFNPPMSKGMKKSVSSMRSAGTRHLVGGYRGGSKLHKAATPTLATRNFRGKYE